MHVAKKVILALVSIVIAIVALELILRVVQPFGFRIKGQSVSLPTNTSVTYRVKPTAKLDSLVTVTKNSLGFRGKEPPARFDSYLTIVTVGGSTTESIMINEGQTWTDLVGKHLSQHFSNVWINNGGLEGHSTFGHLVLLKEYLTALRPRYALFLVGTNDLALFEAREWGVLHSKTEARTVQEWLAEHSEIVRLYTNLQRYQASSALGLTSQEVIDFANTVASGEEYPDYRVLGETSPHYNISDLVGTDSDLNEYLMAYRSRLIELITLARSNHIEPILLTQPAVYGPAIDDLTGTDLGKMAVLTTNGEFGEGMTGTEKWWILETYNSATRQVAQEHDVHLIDLARQLPKSTRFFYDFIHFSNAGSEKVAEIVYQELCSYLASREPELMHTPCQVLE